MSSLAIRRIMSEYKKLQEDPDPEFVAAPADESDLFKWHFIIKGPKESVYEGGLYHGVLLLPPTYPASPPDIMFLTPNGRFKTNEKICITYTSYHTENWNPLWNIRLMIKSLISFFLIDYENGIGSMAADDEERKRLANESRNWHCSCSLHLD